MDCEGMAPHDGRATVVEDRMCAHNPRDPRRLGSIWHRCTRRKEDGRPDSSDEQISSSRVNAAAAPHLSPAADRTCRLARATVKTCNTVCRGPFRVGGPLPLSLSATNVPGSP